METSDRIKMRTDGWPLRSAAGTAAVCLGKLLLLAKYADEGLSGDIGYSQELV